MTSQQAAARPFARTSILFLFFLALALPRSAQAQGLRPMPAQRYSEPSITFQSQRYLRDTFEGPGPAFDPMWSTSYQYGGVYVDGLGNAVLDAGTVITPAAESSPVALFSSSVFSAQSFSLTATLSIAPATTGDRCLAVGVGDWATGPGPQTTMAVFLCDPGDVGSDEAFVFLLTGAPGQDMLQDSVNDGNVFPLGVPFPSSADTIVLGLDFTLTDPLSGNGTLTATVTSSAMSFTHTLTGFWDPNTPRIVGLSAGVGTTTDPAQTTSQVNTLAIAVDEVWSTFLITPDQYVSSLAPFELNGVDYDGRGLFAPDDVVELFLEGGGDPDAVLADDTAIHADGVTNYAVALVTTTFGPRVSVITPLSVADLLSFSEVASVDGYYPNVFVAQGYGHDYLVDLPPLTDIMCSCPTPSTTVAEMTAYVLGLQLPSSVQHQLLNKLSAIDPNLSVGNVAQTTQRVYQFIVLLQNAVNEGDVAVSDGNTLLAASGALVACLSF